MPTLVTIAGFSVAAQSKSDFTKKWEIEGYVYFGITFSPEEEEKDDFLHFHDNGTFSSREVGKVETGTWKWLEGEEEIQVFQDEESLVMKVVEVREDELTLLLEEDGDSIKVKYRAAPNRN